MNRTKLSVALLVTLTVGHPAWAGESAPFARFTAWTKHVSGSSCDEGCSDCATHHVCDRDDAHKVDKLICKLSTDHKADRRERAAAKLDDYDCCCYPEIIPALVAALSDCEAEVREEAAESLGELRCCEPEVTAALEGLLSDPKRGVRKQAKRSLRKCGIRVEKVRTCGFCGGCSHCGTCGCETEPSDVTVFDMPAPNISYDELAPAPMPETEPES